MDAFTRDLDMNPQALTQEPKSIGSVAQLTEYPSSRMECPPNLKYSHQQYKSLAKWEYQSVYHLGGVSDELYRTNKLKIQEHLVPIGVFVIPTEHPPISMEPNQR